MEDSFRVRVDKAFGSLSSPSRSPSLSSLWCLTDKEIERREWSRERDGPDEAEPRPYPPNLDGFFANQQNLSSSSSSSQSSKTVDLQDDDNNDSDVKVRLRQPHLDDEEWDIRSSIGLDSTLDLEEEEDAFDKVAIGSEKAGDRMYMRDITGCGTDDINFYDELPNTFNDVTRDPRANHMAAKLRLKEDAEAAGKFDSLQVSDTGRHDPHTQNNILEEGFNMKSILKRKENQTDPKAQKRVRFGSDCEEVASEGVKDLVMENRWTEEAKILQTSFLSQEYHGVPDYIRNPSKYTHYTFDSSSDIDEESNQKACIDFLNQLKRSNSKEQQPDDTAVDLPKSVTFTPKKKLGDAFVVKNGNQFSQKQEDVGKESIPQNGCPLIGIAAGEACESEVCAMEEDEPETVDGKSSRLRREGRQYRTKANPRLDVPIT
ncbi:uncharacterized protein LOC130768182 [Actinidia eriantha]|uniref:uncharacterized protein LOC130768182 n=1 Tax=Actinidia eriantha TaxID=165200 RepID=UPI00258EF7B1|nr:uncharacterized protein LOC130768182 [Actinidia eriantha]